MMAFPERIIPNYLTHFLLAQLRNATAKAKIHGTLEDGNIHGVVKFLAIALLAWWDRRREGRLSWEPCLIDLTWKVRVLEGLQYDSDIFKN